MKLVIVKELAVNIVMLMLISMETENLRELVVIVRLFFMMRKNVQNIQIFVVWMAIMEIFVEEEKEIKILYQRIVLM